MRVLALCDDVTQSHTCQQRYLSSICSASYAGMESLFVSPVDASWFTLMVHNEHEFFVLCSSSVNGRNSHLHGAFSVVGPNQCCYLKLTFLSCLLAMKRPLSITHSLTSYAVQYNVISSDRTTFQLISSDDKGAKIPRGCDQTLHSL